MLGIEQAQRCLVSQVRRKAVQQRRLVGRLVHPVRGVAEVRLTALVGVQVQGVCVVGQVLAHHPAERHDAGRVRRVALRRRLEVTVVLLVHISQGMALDHVHLERRHEGRPLVDATGPVLARQVFETAALKLDLLLVVFRRCDALELGASAVELGRRTHGAGPAAVVPRHTYRKMPQWKVVHCSLPLSTCSAVTPFVWFSVSCLDCALSLEATPRNESRAGASGTGPPSTL